MAVTKVRHTDAITVVGTTPTLTIGDAGAEDTKIVFDGNAQDYYMGLDDTDDDFKIGLGSAVGTTAHMVFDESGQILKPLQPAFRLRNSSSLTNVTGDGTSYTVVWNAEDFDIGSNCSGGVFTAPVAGIYAFSVSFLLSQIASNHTSVLCEFVFSTDENARGVYYGLDDASDASGYLSVSTSVVAVQLAASETCHVIVTVGGGSKVVDIDYLYNSVFCGYLLG